MLSIIFEKIIKLYKTLNNYRHDFIIQFAIESK